MRLTIVVWLVCCCFYCFQLRADAKDRFSSVSDGWPGFSNPIVLNRAVVSVDGVFDDFSLGPTLASGWIFAQGTASLHFISPQSVKSELSNVFTGRKMLSSLAISNKYLAFYQTGILFFGFNDTSVWQAGELLLDVAANEAFSQYGGPALFATDTIFFSTTTNASSATENCTSTVFAVNTSSISLIWFKRLFFVCALHQPTRSESATLPVFFVASLNNSLVLRFSFNGSSSVVLNDPSWNLVFKPLFIGNYLVVVNSSYLLLYRAASLTLYLAIKIVEPTLPAPIPPVAISDVSFCFAPTQINLYFVDLAEMSMGVAPLPNSAVILNYSMMSGVKNEMVVVVEAPFNRQMNMLTVLLVRYLPQSGIISALQLWNTSVDEVVSLTSSYGLVLLTLHVTSTITYGINTSKFLRYPDWQIGTGTSPIGDPLYNPDTNEVTVLNRATPASRLRNCFSFLQQYNASSAGLSEIIELPRVASYTFQTIVKCNGWTILASTGFIGFVNENKQVEVLLRFSKGSFLQIMQLGNVVFGFLDALLIVVDASVRPTLTERRNLPISIWPIPPTYWSNTTVFVPCFLGCAAVMVTLNSSSTISVTTIGDVDDFMNIIAPTQFGQTLVVSCLSSTVEDLRYLVAYRVVDSSVLWNVSCNSQVVTATNTHVFAMCEGVLTKLDANTGAPIATAVVTNSECIEPYTLELFNDHLFLFVEHGVCKFSATALSLIFTTDAIDKGVLIPYEKKVTSKGVLLWRTSKTLFVVSGSGEMLMTIHIAGFSMPSFGRNLIEIGTTGYVATVIDELFVVIDPSTRSVVAQFKYDPFTDVDAAAQTFYVTAATGAAGFDVIIFYEDFIMFTIVQPLGECSWFTSFCEQPQAGCVARERDLCGWCPLGYCIDQTIVKECVPFCSDLNSQQSTCAAATTCSYCQVFGYCSNGQQCLCSTIMEEQDCSSTHGVCQWDSAHQLCADGVCFSFIVKGYSSQPYFLFGVSILKDIIIVVLLCVLEPQLATARFFAKSMMKLRLPRKGSTTRVFLDRQNILFHANQLLRHQEEKGTSANTEDRSNNHAADDEGSKTDLLRFHIAAWMVANSKWPTVPDAGGEIPTFASVDSTLDILSGMPSTPTIFVTSDSVAMRVASTIKSFPSTITLCCYAAAISAATLINLHNIFSQSTIGDLSQSTVFQLSGFLFINSGSIATVSLITVKYVTTMWREFFSAERCCCRGGTDSSSVLQFALSQRIRRSPAVHILTWIIFANAFPYVFFICSQGMYRYAFVPAGAIVLTIVSSLGASCFSVRTRHHDNGRAQEEEDAAVPLVDNMRNPVLKSGRSQEYSSTDQSQRGLGVEVPAASRSTAMNRNTYTNDEPTLKPITLISSVGEFLLVQEVPTILMALVLQATFNYAVLFTHDDLYSVDYWELMLMEFNSRSYDCYKAKVGATFQELSGFVPFM